MKYSTNMLIYSMITASTIMVMSSNNWMSMWLAMEMNLMSFIPLMFETKNNLLTQSCMTYFLSQSMGSILFLMSMLTNKYTEMMNQEMVYMTITASMALKLGTPPFHSWMPQVMEKISWNKCWILMTWQKLAPMFIMSIVSQNKMTLVVIVMAATISSILGMNQTSLRKIMAYSTMMHMSWMIASMSVNDKLWVNYFIMYSAMVTMTVMYFKKMNIMNINQMNSLNMNLMEKINFISAMMSMGGLPPFIGFMPKWIVLTGMIQTKEMFLMTFMLLMNLIPMFYYIRICTPVSLFISQSQKWMLSKESPKKSYIFMLNMMLPPAILSINFF